MAQVEKAGTTGEATYEWDNLMERGLESCFGYRGSDAGFITLTGNTPESEWIANTMFRRWMSDECICGCGRSAYSEDEDRPEWGGGDSGRRYLRPDCQQRFTERLRETGAADEIIKVVEENRWSGEYGDAEWKLQEIYRALWSSEIRRGLRGQLHDAEEKVKDAERTAQEAQAEQQRVRQALGVPPTK